MRRAVEKVFRLQGEGKIPSSGILGVRTQTGGLHVKTASLSGAKNYIVAKLNTNFPQNYARFGQPTIQGVIPVRCRQRPIARGARLDGNHN